MIDDVSFKDMLIEIRVFGTKPTLDSIEKIKNPQYRRKMRKLFEQAFIQLRDNDWQFSQMQFPYTHNQKEHNNDG